MRFVPAVAAAALAVATLASPAAASPNDVNAAAPCGFYTKGIQARYNHCAPDGRSVWITVKRRTGTEFEKCVTPGDHYLGAFPYSIVNAWYNGKLC